MRALIGRTIRWFLAPPAARPAPGSKTRAEVNAELRALCAGSGRPCQCDGLAEIDRLQFEIAAAHARLAGHCVKALVEAMRPSVSRGGTRAP